MARERESSHRCNGGADCATRPFSGPVKPAIFLRENQVRIKPAGPNQRSAKPLPPAAGKRGSRVQSIATEEINIITRRDRSAHLEEKSEPRSGATPRYQPPSSGIFRPRLGRSL